MGFRRGDDGLDAVYIDSSAGPNAIADMGRTVQVEFRESEDRFRGIEFALKTDGDGGRYGPLVVVVFRLATVYNDRGAFVGRAVQTIALCHPTKQGIKAEIGQEYERTDAENTDTHPPLALRDRSLQLARQRYLVTAGAACRWVAGQGSVE